MAGKKGHGKASKQGGKVKSDTSPPSPSSFRVYSTEMWNKTLNNGKHVSFVARCMPQLLQSCPCLQQFQLDCVYCSNPACTHLITSLCMLNMHFDAFSSACIVLTVFVCATGLSQAVEGVTFGSCLGPVGPLLANEDKAHCALFQVVRSAGLWCCPTTSHYSDYSDPALIYFHHLVTFCFITRKKPAASDSQNDDMHTDILSHILNHCSVLLDAAGGGH